MEKNWLVLCYCNNHWKANTLTTSIYSQWYKHYHKKMLADAKENKLKDSEPVRKKAKMTIVVDNSSSSSDHQQNETYLVPLITSYSLLKPLILDIRRR